MAGTITHSGGVRIGDGPIAFNATWPSVKLTATPEQIDLACYGRELHFPRESILRLLTWSGVFTTGLRIEHNVEGYPEYVVFWTFRFGRLARQLHKLGYEIDEQDL